MTNLAPLSAIASPSQVSPTADHLAVILHGWGANAQDLYPLGAALNLPNYHYLFVNAPFPHPQIPQGRAWYNLESPNFDGLAESRQALQDYLLTLATRTQIPLANTVLGGFSQGGAMSLDVGLTLPIAGIFALSGYLHFQPESSDLSPPPIFMTHGTQDQVVPIAMARQAQEALKSVGATVEYQEFAMGHEIPPPVLGRLQQFLKGIASPPV
ncbi:MAG: alpha/beta hydrolase [Synechocystis sp.]|jgi:phospholipase/carboxylesterase